MEDLNLTMYDTKHLPVGTGSAVCPRGKRELLLGDGRFLRLIPGCGTGILP